MPHLFGPPGQAALTAAVRRRPLLAFDFDGTLAPIVEHPGHARVPGSVASRLRRLREVLRVAIITGRSIRDVRPRLKFEPHFIVGNHGAETGDPDRERLGRAALDPVRQRLAKRGPELAAAGVTVEDKGLSLALHYRLAPDPAQARAIISEIVPADVPNLRVCPGKMVANIMHADGPDKAQALRELLARCGSASAIFVGDDVNDEPVFACAPRSWLTVRVGRDAPDSKAAYFLDDTAEVATLLDRILQVAGCAAHSRQ